jgi:hypothetical protein
MRQALPFAALSLVVLAGCSSGGGDASATSEDEVTNTTYVDIGDYWKNEGDQNAWFALRQQLTHEFDNVCGDTFCGGDYSNLTSLGFTCAVTSARGSVHECVWTFGGSSHLVNGGTGTVEASVATFQCRVAPKTSARALLTTLSAKGAETSLHRTLPGSTQSLYDVIGDCFQHPVGASPISQGTGTTYVDAIDSYDAGTDVDAFFNAGDALRAGFDNVCGDTFCEGDYGNLEALRLACSVRGTTGTLRSCKWLFAGSYNDVDSKSGAITVHAKTYQCALPVRGTANQLSSALNAPSVNGDDAIHRVLPGSTKSAYDVLVNCL